MSRAQSKKIKVVLGMSGGVDSSVAALLLKRQGYEVIGAFIKNWSDEVGKKQLCWVEDRRDALRVAARLGIPFRTFDFEPEFRKYVVDYLYNEYAAGRTPNPDIMCNKFIKFPMLLREAKKLGADYIATGHYVRIKNQESGIKGRKIYELYKAVDQGKDQSYFLYTLDQEILKHCLFPLGELTKKAVRQIAAENKLATAKKPDSQGICFMGEMKMREFLRKRLKDKPGNIVTGAGQVIGKHDGLFFYTIGQRQGIGIGGRKGASNEPLYVIAKDLKANNLIVGPANTKKLFTTTAKLENVHWISKASAPAGKINVKVRYHASDAPAKLELKNGRCILHFRKGERAVTSGQSAVFYDREKMLGGGIIK
jgi:tRNA-specific 2-thiouridylase